ncbi:MAG: hypothetical protein OEV37_00320 [Candidatus Berkelbacteria bacterium]|nr:hypothetical protein [Candidatus Berkelbacteria bacterium]
MVYLTVVLLQTDPGKTRVSLQRMSDMHVNTVGYQLECWRVNLAWLATIGLLVSVPLGIAMATEGGRMWIVAAWCLALAAVEAVVAFTGHFRPVQFREFVRAHRYKGAPNDAPSRRQR